MVSIYCWSIGIYGVIPFLLLFQWGYLYTGLWALAQSLKRSGLRISFGRLQTALRPSLRIGDFE